MDVHYYKAASREVAFRMAGRDSANWEFSELEALGRMADAFARGFTPSQKTGSGWLCFCEGASFLLFEDRLREKGYGISLLQLVGHESGIDDPAAQELLNRHRAKRGQAFYASELLTYSQHISTVEELDEAYRLLEQGRLIERAGVTTSVTHDGSTFDRPLFVCP